jgi:two-component system sensor histidine kinase PhoQ
MTFSLRKRFFIFTAIASIIVMLVSSLILNYVYTLELKTEAQDKLRLHIFNLLSVSNFKNNEIALPVILSNPDFNRENSPLFSYVTNQENQKVWQSLSLSKEIHIEDKQSKTGKWNFGEIRFEQDEYLWASYGISWNQSPKSYRYMVAVNSQLLNDVIMRFRIWLVGGFIFVSLLFLLIQHWVLKLAFNPIKSLKQEIIQLENGNQDHIMKQYPKELVGVSHNINALIKKERNQREKYRTSMADLAHSLKTPVAIINNELGHSNDNLIVHNALSRINETIEYQLRKAVISGPHVISQGVNIEKSVNDVVSALQKIHIDRQIIVKITVPSDVTFPGDSNDLLEVLGNLLDNGFKYAKSTISVNVSTRNNKLIITIEDDGNGLLSEDCMIIFNRGLRIDETPNGQGLGLSIVKNVIESYHGSIEASTSPLGGARFMIEIPLRTHNENN